MKMTALFCIFLFVMGLASTHSQNGTETGYDSIIRQHMDIVSHAEVPQYPPIALRAHLSGTVHLHAFVEKGEVVKTESDSPVHLLTLIHAATENVKTWQFPPNARGVFDVTYIYELQENEGAFPENPHIEMQLPTMVKISAKPVKPKGGAPSGE
jgi:hypothetical protein